MKTNCRSKTRLTNEAACEIIKEAMWSVDRMCPRGITPERMAKVTNEFGVPIFCEMAESDTFLKCIQFEHLLLPEKYHPIRPIDPQNNLSSIIESTPLEAAIRHGNFPPGTTRKKLEMAGTRYGTGWDMVKRRLRMTVCSSKWPEPMRYESARKTLLRFPELLTGLDPLKRQHDAKILIGLLGRQISVFNLMKMKNISAIVIFMLKCGPQQKDRHWFDRDYGTHVLKLCLLGRLPAADGLGDEMVQKRLIRYAKDLTKCLLWYPKAACVLDHDVKLHGEIITQIEKIAATQQLPARTRKHFMKNPSLCAVLL